MEFIEQNEFEALFKEGLLLLDVRSEIEWERGQLPNAFNLPLLNTAERVKVGTEYKHRGKEAAIALGQSLVSGQLRVERIEGWRRLTAENKIFALYCARGGLRSKISQEWLAREGGVPLPRVRGGFKALRRFLIEQTRLHSETGSFIQISGKTGSGKTHFLNSLSPQLPVLDLEQHALHRGSVFGSVYGPQPAQVTFENSVAIDLLRLRSNYQTPVLLESESRKIGWVSIPEVLFAAMRRCPIVAIELPFEQRVENIISDYVSYVFSTFKSKDPYLELENYILGCLNQIKRRLGLERAEQLTTLVQEAIRLQRSCGELAGHKGWVEPLLTEYYDKFYEYHLDSYRDRIILRGTPEEIRNYLLLSAQENRLTGRLST